MMMALPRRRARTPAAWIPPGLYFAAANLVLAITHRLIAARLLGRGGITFALRAYHVLSRAGMSGWRCSRSVGGTASPPNVKRQKRSTRG